MADTFESVVAEYDLDADEQQQLNDLIVFAVKTTVMTRSSSTSRAIEYSNASEKIKKAATTYFRYQQLRSEVGG